MSVREYVGARYVPKFKVPLEHDPDIAYEPLTVVTSASGKGDSYVSRCYIEPGVQLTDPRWILTYHWDAQVFAVQQDIMANKTAIDEMRKEVDGNKGEIGKNAATLAAMEPRLKKCEDGVTANLNSIGGLNGRVAALEGKVYPVGAVYMSFSPTSPASLFGGSWLELRDVFPYFNGNTSVGGSNSHTMTIAEMPKHNHKLSILGSGGNSGGVDWSYGINNASYTGTAGDNISGGYIQTTGAGASFVTHPKYQTVYAWRRTA